MAKQKSDFKIPEGQLIAQLSITEKEFSILLPFFEKTFDTYFARYTLEGKARIRLNCKRNDSVFKTAGDALFFLLFYLKSYPIESVMASIFNMHQPQVNTWKQLLQKILEDAFLSMKVLPARDSKNLNRLLKEMGLTELIIDATERQIQRPKDYQVQKEYYSGKKKDIRSRTPLSVIPRAIM